MHYKEAKKILDAINTLFAQSKEARAALCFQGYDLLQAMQQGLFAFIVRYLKSGEISKETRLSRFYRVCFIVLCRCINALTHVALVCRFMRSDVLVYSVDKVSGPYGNDFRLNSLYEHFEESNISYVEFFHTLSITQLLTHLWKRKRLAFYQPAFEKITRPHARSYGVQATDGVDVDLLAAIEKRVCNYRFDFEHTTSSFSSFLKRARIKKIFLIDDTRHYHRLLFAAKKLGVLTYAIQHGHFTKYHVGVLKTQEENGMYIKPSMLYVWDAFWKQRLDALGSIFDENELRVGFHEKGTLSLKRKTEGTIHVLVPFETDAPHAEVKEYLDMLLAQEDVRVFFKVRPDVSPEEQLATYGLEKHPHLSTVSRTEDIPEGVSACLGVYSTYLYEIYEVGIPVGIFDTSMDYGYGIVESGLGTLFSCRDGTECAALLKDIVSAELSQKQKSFS